MTKPWTQYRAWYGCGFGPGSCADEPMVGQIVHTHAHDLIATCNSHFCWDWDGVSLNGTDDEG